MTDEEAIKHINRECNKHVKQLREKQKKAIQAGADQMSGDGGYGIGTQENYEEFVRQRNYPIPGTKQ